ncbi:MAG TPA: arylesterase [Opitutaceae bacterium]|nr:arylesterase [Opitutaceae bacterium]HRJ47626.1 arylesterase [Opitutaceae bacterium]
MNVRWLSLVLFFCPVLHAAPPPPTIVFLGDSLTAGYGLENPLAEAYPALIQEKLRAAGLPHRVVNAGISGDTTAGGLRRLNWILRQPVDVLVIALGGNDGLRGIDPAVTRDNLQGIIDRTREKYPAVRLVLAGMQMPANMNEEFTRAYREIFPALAEANGIALIPFLLEGIGADPAFNQPDLIHPTAAGQVIIADTVWKHLRPVL